jgi:hybrid cluster-associated redox disulfide protein
MSERFNKDMTFAQALQIDQQGVAGVLKNYHLGCIGCMGAQNESLEQGCQAHGLDVNDILRDLNAIPA